MADEKLIFPIGFDLDGGVKEASKEWKSTYQKQLQEAIDKKPLKAKIELQTKGLDLEALKEFNKISKESVKAAQANAKIQKANIQVTERQRIADERVAAAHERTLAATNRRLVAEEKLTQAKQRSTRATTAQNEAYKTQSSYLQRLTQRMIAYASITQAFSFLRNIREVTAEFELQRVALGSIIGDLNEANAMFEQIKAAAVKSPFQIKELVTYTKQLAAYKIETDELFETTQKLADVSAGLGVGMERLVLAYGQIRATGYLRASEVRQLTEAGIPIVEELAKKMSQLRGETVSAAEVMGMISERAISFGMVKEVFDDMTSAGGMFYKMQEKQAETLEGQWSNLQDSISIMYEEMGNTERVNNAMKGMIGLIKSLAENWRDVYSVAQSLSVAMGVYYVAMKNATVASTALSIAEATRLSTLKATTIYMPKFLASTKLAITLTHSYRVAVIKSATATGLLSKAFWGLTKAMLSNPYTAVLAALAGLATLLLTTESRAKRLSKELSKIGKDGAIQIDQSARNFERLAKAIRESADGSEKQTAALAELKRSYGELLPSQDKEIKALVQEKANYDSLIKSIKRKIELQIQEQKINKIASEYGTRISGAETDFKSLLAQYGLTKEDANKVTSAVKDAVDAGLLSVNNSAKENAHKLKMIIKEQTGLDILKGMFDPMQIFTQKYGKEMRNEFGNLVGVMSEYNAQIEEVGGSLDHLDDKGKNLSDTFNTWQKELASITEGKNLKGEGIRLFDDESITQINKLTDATARVADEYDKLAEEKKAVDKALKSEGAKADKDTYAKLQERLGKINEGMSGLYDFLKKYGALDLIKSDDKTQKSAEQALKDELAAVEKIYKRYQDLRKLKSETDTQSILANEFKGVSLITLSKAYSPKQMIKVYQKALAEAQRLGKKDLVLEIQTKIGEFNVAEEQRKLEKSLKDLSDRISRTKTAKEFFDRMLGMTGDKEFSASLTLSVYGEGGDLGKKLAEQTIEELEAAFEGVDISKAIDKTTGKVDYAKLAPLVEQLPEKAQANAQALVRAGEKANADWLIDLQNTYEKAFTFEERRTQVMKREAENRKKIEQDTSLTPEAKAKLIEASKSKEAKDIASINLEEFKASEDYIKIFEDLDNLATPTIERLMAKLKEFIETNKDLSPEQVKTLMNEYQKLYDGLINRNPFKAIADGIKEYSEALKSGDKDAKRSAITKVQKGFEGVENAFSSAANSVNELAKSLGFAEDSDTAVFLQGIAKAFGFVAISITLAKVAMDLFDKETKKFLTTNPFGWVLAIGSAVVGVLSAISNAKVRKADKEIKHQQDLIDSLGKSYEKLEKQIEKTFGSDYLKNYNDRLANLYAQQEAYLKQAEAERSKGKKEDEEKTQGYLDSASDVAEQIADMQKEVSERFLGTDLASAARDFAQSWIDAYKEFGSTTDAMKEKFHDMIQNMVVESIAGRMMQQLLQPVFDAIDDYSKDGQLDEREIATIADLGIGLIDTMDESMTSLVERLRAAGYDIRQSTSGLTGISKDIASASEESILGLAAGINTQNFYISQVPPKLDTIIALLQGGGVQVGGGVNMQDLITIQNQHLSHLPNIAQNTAETVARCERAANACERMADQLDRVIKPRGTQATHTVNTSL
jgi:hypothetical protein